MKPWKAVIGSNYGDEGKGLLTDYFANQLDGRFVVVRFNGGAQASHTVQTIDGARHAFSHFGSGSFNESASTFLARHFILNMTVFNMEGKKLKEHFDIIPKVYVDERCFVTLPVDVGFNQVSEENRGDNRHGSCGLGIAETIERSQFDDFQIRASDLLSGERLMSILNKIYNEWVPFRARELDIDHDLIKQQSETNTWQWLKHTMNFLEKVVITSESIIDSFKDNVIFEGAQGLALDMSLYSPQNPHVTRSYCGLHNVYEILSNSKRHVDATYVTRSYLTRHGAGPLPGELQRPSWLSDETNITNKWQGSLRFAPLDIDVVNQRILKDIANVDSRQEQLTFNTAVTCLDQFEINTEHLLNHTYSSYGPTQIDVVKKS